MSTPAFFKFYPRRALVCALFTSAVACAGASAETADPDVATVPAEDEADLEEPSATTSATSDAEAVPSEGMPETSEDEQPAQRQVKYVMSSEGLEIEVLGIRFLAHAKPVKLKDGWGVDVSLEGTSKGEKRNVLMPKNGPLAFAGSVTRNGESTRFGDKRDGDKGVDVGPNKPLKSTREWPGTLEEKPLKPGDSLELQVGLWGIGEDSESRRPVKQFFLLKMVVDKKTPQPLIMPPASATK